jgi:hypothetical protein
VPGRTYPGSSVPGGRPTAITADHTGNASHDQAIAGVLPVQGVVVQSLKTHDRHSPVVWMMRHLVDEATPELEHLREGAAPCGKSVSRKYSALYG